MRVFGLWSWVPIRALGLLLGFAIVGLVFALTAAMHSPAAAAIASLVCTYFLSYELNPWDGVGVNGEPLAIVWVLLACLLFARLQGFTPARGVAEREAPSFARLMRYTPRGRLLRLAGVGFLLGLAGLTKQMFLLHAVPIALWAFLDPRGDGAPLGRDALVQRARALGALAVGFAVPYAVVLGVYAATRGTQAPPAAASGHDHAAMSGGAGAGATAKPVSLGDDQARRIGVTYAVATVGPLAKEVRTVGQLTFDETRLQAISPKIDGWVERLFVNSTGQPVAVGQPLLTIYAPMLVQAQDATIAKIDTQYLPKLEAIISDIAAARRRTADLLKAENRPDQQRALESNRDSQKIADSAAQSYRRYLQQQREQIAKARLKASHDLKIADNTYETVEASVQLRDLMRESSTSFEAIQKLESPSLDQIFKNEELRKEFEDLTRKLDAPAS